MNARKLCYPKIRGSRNCPAGRCIAFEKYDGTNMHWSWDREFGWHAFGTRRDEFNLTDQGISDFTEVHAHLSKSANLFMSSLAEGLEKIFIENANYKSVSEVNVFAEYFGPGSFAGLHMNDEEMELRLFDVWLEGFGFIAPKQFVQDFKSLPIARVVYEGKLTGKFADDVREGKYNVEEGVVCKGGAGGEDLWMAKIKTNAYMARLKKAFAENWEQYWE